MRVLFLADVYSGCTWYRQVLPGHELTKSGHGARVRIGRFNKADLEWADVIVAQRLWDDLALAAIRWANVHGKLTVYDLDDDLWTIGSHNEASKFWGGHHKDAERVIAECSRCTTTGDYLAEVIRRHNGDVRVIPNALPDDWRSIGGKHEGLTIGWAGSNSHSLDLLTVKDAVYDVLDSRDVSMIVCGCHPLEHDKIERVDPVPIERYHQLVSRFDIGIAPLVDDHFNRCKSDLKIHEYAGLGIPWVASDVGPYSAARHGYAGFLASSPEEWRTHLLRLIDDAVLRSKMSKRALTWARRMSKTMPRWMDAWSA
jgi:glycosyltransferase involved in cell wall biosynthesis